MNRGQRGPWHLYHGTSTLKLKTISLENRLRVSVPGDQTVAMSIERTVAEYFACTAVDVDQHDRPREESDPVVLVLDGERLLACGYQLEGFPDEASELDWENEIACLSDIHPLHKFLIGVGGVSADRVRAFFRAKNLQRRRRPFRPPGPPLALYELRVMEDISLRLADGKITQNRASMIRAAMDLLRFTVRSSEH
jgi:hypothetical protein